MSARPAILATGSCLPDTIRSNDDPIFDWLHQNPPPNANLFEGYDQRRVLAPGEQLVDRMVDAARSALQRAGLAAADVDLLIGYASVSTWEMPNDLTTVATKLELASTTPVIPINSEYSNFNHGLVVADALISTGRATRALVVVGSNWTRYVDYHTPPAISVGDGAGAAVVAMSDDPALFRVRDVASDADPQYLGGMYLAADPTSAANRPAHVRGAGLPPERHRSGGLQDVRSAPPAEPGPGGAQPQRPLACPTSRSSGIRRRPSSTMPGEGTWTCSPRSSSRRSRPTRT